MSPRAFLLAAALLASPAAAQQQSASYKFLQAVKEGKGNDVIAMVDKPGSSIINARDVTSGEGALHIVVKRGDEAYLRYLLQKGADPNLRDARGTTPLLLAVESGQNEAIAVLTGWRANPNLGNGGGETPLIRAVQRRDLAQVRLLLAAKANPDQTDNLTGKSARDYARDDARSPAIAKLIEETPRGATRAGAGPK